MILAYKTMSSPVGNLKLVAKNDKLAGVLWENDRPNRVRFAAMVEDPQAPVLLETERQLAEYFNRHRTRFDIPLDLAGTDFQQAVWQALLTIPFGETRTYSQVAEQIGRPKAMRAMGAANGRNPIAIIAPCHRVIGASGALTGFAGGLEAKQWLLDLEKSDAAA